MHLTSQAGEFVNFGFHKFVLPGPPTMTLLLGLNLGFLFYVVLLGPDFCATAYIIAIYTQLNVALRYVQL